MKTEQYLNSSVNKYLEDLSRRQMTPGGGSAAALGASLGAGLNLMVINYSKKEGKEDGDLTSLKIQQEESLKRLKAFVDEDCRVFEDLMRTLSEKKDAERAYKAAASVPLCVCEECAGSLYITGELLSRANPNLKSDIGCAWHMLKGAFFSAKINVNINLKFVGDEAFCEKTRKRMEEMEFKIRNMEKVVAAKI
ncbi:MAG: cyclodeaminase/cyclohydrolase family protein [Candidatus Omnitrophota bacterium]